MNRNYQNNQKGFALLLAIIVASVVLSIGISILNISINQLNLSSTARESEFAFQAAHAGMDCMMYWANQRYNDFLNPESAAPNIRCFGTNPLVRQKFALPPDPAGYANLYRYQYEWDEEYPRCTEMELFTINALSDDYVVNFNNEGIGSGGVKTCTAESVCLIIISQGYNLPCEELDTNIFAVQREIVLEY